MPANVILAIARGPTALCCRTMRKAVATLLVLSVVLLSACGGDATGDDPGAGAGDVPVGELPTTIELGLTDRFSIKPSPIQVPAGVPITFVIKNTGTLDHEVYIGDADAHAAHEEEMLASPLPEVDPAVGVIVPPGETRELVVTFDAGSGPLIAGCHIPSHYGRGMRAPINVVS